MTQLRLAHVNLQIVSKPRPAKSPICATCSTVSSEKLLPSVVGLLRLHQLRPGEASVIDGMVNRLLAEVVPPDER